jgi:hypothetical protein
MDYKVLIDLIYIINMGKYNYWIKDFMKFLNRKYKNMKENMIKGFFIQIWKLKNIYLPLP